MEIAENILLTIATASTPLLIAALGELVVERSGVHNLGVERSGGRQIVTGKLGGPVIVNNGFPDRGVIAAAAVAGAADVGIALVRQNNEIGIPSLIFIGINTTMRPILFRWSSAAPS